MMNSIKSFRGYGKVDPVSDQEFRCKARRRMTILVISAIVLIAVVIGAVAGTVVHVRNKDNSSPNTELTSSASLKAVCDVTLYPTSCYSSISSLDNSNTTDPEVIFKLSLHAAANELKKFSNYITRHTSKTNDKKLKAALLVCETLFDDAVDMLNESISSMEVNKGEKLLTTSKLDDIKTWLSTSLTDQETCVDALQDINARNLEDIKSRMKNSTEFGSNSLAIAAKILGLLAHFNIPIHRKLLGYEGIDEFPRWLSVGDRRLLQDASPVPTATVAQDGSGDCKTINEAVGKVANKSIERFVIYVKAGVYIENVVLDKSKWNVMMYGDGKDKTIVTGGLNFVDGTPTFATATVAVSGKGFIAKDMKFVNTAGPHKHQAVAFRSGSDQSVFYKCAFDAFQDTLYPHSNRQFYRDCDITGTVDFIFGNAAVVFQNCNIQPRQPMANQFDTITAQGKKDPNQNTGISIQKCTFTPFDNLTASTFLGRPWKEFSTTIIMQSNIDSFLDPKGWREWVNGVEPPSSIFYAEYQNTGPGASVSQRVTWPGYKPTLTEAEASKFTVGTFIHGNQWLTESKVQYDSHL